MQKCRECGTAFTPAKPNQQVYCSQQCRWKQAKTLRKTRIVPAAERDEAWARHPGRASVCVGLLTSREFDALDAIDVNDGFAQAPALAASAGSTVAAFERLIQKLSVAGLVEKRVHGYVSYEKSAARRLNFSQPCYGWQMTPIGRRLFEEALRILDTKEAAA